jgi:hypothetical protein
MMTPENMRLTPELIRSKALKIKKIGNSLISKEDSKVFVGESLL